MTQPLKQRLIECAYECYLEGGLDQVSMRNIGRKAGVSQMAPYSHFKNKDQLIAALIDFCFGKFVATLQGAYEGDDPVENLRRMGGKVLLFALESPELYTLIFLTQRDPELTLANARADLKGELSFQILAGLVNQCVEAGELEAEDAELLALTIFSQTHGLIALHLAGRLGLDREAFEEVYWQSMDTLMDPRLAVPYAQRAKS